ncbi:hypothetical protein PaelaDRAFT_4320 [Paenibacillus lactis 154]|uniref:Uncharacterized protein n=1 Tax=Paenibacillus lactis 154 TaxID=743719 RepID=G4HJX3_9BACL|nr:hypothetical protein PaelaDRAFT_4320 [Paenibacillus lactis 154]
MAKNDDLICTCEIVNEYVSDPQKIVIGLFFPILIEWVDSGMYEDMSICFMVQWQIIKKINVRLEVITNKFLGFYICIPIKLLLQEVKTTITLYRLIPSII